MLENILDDLYASDISASISWFWAGGIDVALGDESDGIDAEAQVATLADAAEWLRANAVHLYPNSQFAKKHRRAFE